MADHWRNTKMFLAWAFVMWLGFDSLDRPDTGYWILQWYVVFTAFGVVMLMRHASSGRKP